MSPALIILALLKTSVALTVLAVGFKATWSDTVFLFQRPRLLGRAIVAMNVLMPLLALFMVTKLSLDPAVKIALAALSVSPVPPIFPKKTVKVSGTETYSVGLQVAISLLAIILVPLSMNIFQSALGLSVRMGPLAVAKLVFMTIMIPLLAGIAFRGMMPSVAQKLAKPTDAVASALLLVSVLPIVFASAGDMWQLVGNWTLVSLATFALAGLIIGYLLAGPNPEHRSVLSLATSTRHPGLAIAIAHGNFPNQKLALAAIGLYIVIAGVVAALPFPRKSTETASDSEKRTAA
ncbi:MAG TPA: hypothetical protein VH437_15115 [Terriglobales bacterium]